MESSVVYKIYDDLSNLDKILRAYDKEIAKYEEELKLDGKTYSSANAEQAGLMSWYSELADDLGILLEEMERRVKKQRAIAMKKFMGKDPKAYSDKRLEQIIADDKDLEKIEKAKLEVQERHEKAKTALNGFIRRGFSLNNLTQIRIGGFQDEKIRVNE